MPLPSFVKGGSFAAVAGVAPFTGPPPYSHTFSFSPAPADRDYLFVAKVEKVGSGAGALPTGFTTDHTLVVSGSTVSFGHKLCASETGNYAFTGIQSDVAITIVEYTDIVSFSESAASGLSTVPQSPSITVAHPVTWLIAEEFTATVSGDGFFGGISSGSWAGHTGGAIQDAGQSSAFADETFGPGTGGTVNWDTIPHNVAWGAWSIALSSTPGGWVLGGAEASPTFPTQWYNGLVP